MTTATETPTVNGAAESEPRSRSAEPPKPALTEDADGESESKVDSDKPDAILTPPRAATTARKRGAKRPAKKAAKKGAAKRPAKAAPGADDATGEVRRTRRTPLFPAATFEDTLELATAIYAAGSGQPVRRITLFDTLNKSPDSGSTRQLVTNSAKYKLTTGSYSAEQLALTPEGLQAVADDVSAAARARARFRLAIEGVDVFKRLYESYIDNRLPAPAVLMDKAAEFGIPKDDLVECIETFTVNAKFVGVLRTVSGAERLLSIDTVIDDYLPPETSGERQFAPRRTARTTYSSADDRSSEVGFETACFYITPIGEEGTEQRKHSDLFMGALIEPTLGEFGLHLVRADKIGEAGMITGQIIEHIIYSKLVIVDLSYHNPNVFYELALRHAVRKPMVQICRQADRLPFDVSQVRTIVVDTTDIYTLVPQIESLRAQIAAQIRKTLDEKTDVENPLSVFAPYFWEQLPHA